MAAHPFSVRSVRLSRLVHSLVALLAIVQPLQGQAVVPAGFEDTRVAGVAGPTSIAVVPDGRILVGSQFGRVFVIQNGALVPTAALDLSAVVCVYRERGLLGLAVDPSFESNRFIYVAYIFNRFAGNCGAEHASAPAGRVSRFQLNADNRIDRASEVVLLDNIPSPIGIHNLGDVEFGRDGYLYVSVGDGGCDYAFDSGCFNANNAARDMNALVGKILRITRDGGIPPDNPFAGSGSVRCNVTGGTSPGSVCAEIFAFGLRNPWRIAFDPNATGTRFFINDVGEATWEEINEGRAGANYGWNAREGFCANGSTTNCSLTPPSGLTNPIFAYGRGDGCAAITGGAFVPAGVWPPEFNGAYVFGDYVCGRLFRLVQGSDGVFTRHPFITNLGGSSATDVYFGPHAGGVALYYTTFAGGGEVRRIAYVGGVNRTPTASTAASPLFGSPPLTVDFDGRGSSDADGDALTYVWNFGDGTASGSGATVTHVYSAAGIYTATLTVTDPSGASASATIRIDVGNAPPAATIESPVTSASFAVGDSIVLRGSGTDREDGQLAASSLSWTVLRRHNTHTHPFLPPTPGSDVTFTAPGPENLGAGGTSHLEIYLTATDSTGRSTTVSQPLMPRTARMDFLSEPPGATLSIDGSPTIVPTSFTSWVNYDVPVAAASQNASDGARLVFASWSDGGAAAHSIRTPAAASSYTATFTRQTTSGVTAVTASSIENSQYLAAYAVDGDPETRWSSQFSDPQWIALDLGTIVDVTRIVLHWETAYGRAYMLQTSTDGSAWSTVFQTTSGDGGFDDISLTAARGRYVRMYGTGRGTQWGYSLREFQVFTGAAAPGSSPYGGTPAALPGVLQAENFDEGGADVAYRDLSAGNTGGQYRATDVDIGTATDPGGGFRLGWIDAGEWLNYSVTVGAAGTYDIEARVASNGRGGTFHIEVDGVDRTGPLTIPNTGGWHTWATIRKTGMTVAAGPQVWRVVMDATGETGAVGNINWFALRAAASAPPPGSTPYGGAAVMLPGVIQAENFDEGGAGVAYRDLSTGNTGGQYRTTDVDIGAATDTGGGYRLGWIDAGEWLKYSVTVSAAGTYDIEARVASNGRGGTFHIEVDGVDRTGPLTIPNTGGWHTWATIRKTGMTVAAGPQVWRVVMDATGETGAVGNINWFALRAAASAPPPGSTPYGGAAVMLPGVIQAENFDEGGAGVAYRDLSAGNTGGQYRATDVDIGAATDTGGGYRLGWIDAGEWLNYSVTVGAAGTYDIEARVASNGRGGTFHIEVDGVDRTGPLAIPNTGGWQAWSTIRRTGVALAAGPQVWRIVMDAVGETGAVGNINWIRVVGGGGTGGSTPFGGAPAALPGMIEAENFDEGAAGIAYRDLSAGNTGGQYRSTDVDIGAATDTGGGYRLGWLDPGEWLNYTVSVGATGTYDIEVRVASLGSGGMFHIEADGADKTGLLAIPDTGGWQTWTTIRRTGISLTAGTQVWRLVIDSVGAGGAVGNINWIRVSSMSTVVSAAPLRGPYLQQVSSTSAIVAWTTRQAGAAEVRYSGPGVATRSTTAVSRTFPATQTGLPYDFYQHEARLTELTAASTYVYDLFLSGADITNGQDSLTTAPPTGSGTVRFIAFGDSGVGSTAQRQLAARMASDTFQLSLHGGDVAYGRADGLGGPSYRQYDDWVFDIYRPWMRSRPFFPSIGNHDDEIGHAQAYRDVFMLPTNGASAAYPDHAERFYSFDYGPIHFIALDTELAFQDPARRDAQLQWLQADLAATSQPWKVVYLHRPPYSAGPHHGSDIAVRNAFAPIFEQHNVQLVIAAHEHVYERSVPWREFLPGGPGVVYVVTGGGGGALYPSGSAPWTAASASIHHYTRFTVNGCTLTGEAVMADGRVVDRFTVRGC